MERQYYPCTILLKNCPLYVEIIKKYFGLSHPSLETEMSLVENDPERTFEIREYVLFEDIQAQIEDFFPSLNDKDKQLVANLLWLVANLYYGDSYDQYRGYIENEWNYNYNVWRCIEKDMARLYAFLQDHPKEEILTIQMGKDKVELDDAFNWFQDVMNYQVFLNCIPHIHTKEEAQALYRKKAGRHQTREEVNAIVGGIAGFFADEELIKGKAPLNLLKFIRKILVMMDLIDENDIFVTKDWIKSQISNIQKSGKDARFTNLDWEKASSKHLLAQPWEKAMRWISPPK